MAKYTIGDIFKGDYPISQYYGNNPKYYGQFGFNGHEGIDWATPMGTEILAPFKRNIILRDEDIATSRGYGVHIVVWDPDQKCAVWYCHLDSNSVEYKKEYPKGTVIGKTGSSGNSTGPHIHINFVETNSTGGRLNTDNGFKGMLNILDGNLVEWKLGDQPQPVVVQPEGTITISHKTFEELVTKATKYDEFVEAGFDSIDKVKSKDETIENLNKQIGDRNGDITTLGSKITTLEKEKEELDKQIKIEMKKTEDYTQVQKEREELLLQKKTWTPKERDFETRIKELKDENLKLEKNSLWGLLKKLFPFI